MEKGERALVDWLRTRFQPSRFRVPIAIGDDMAAVHHSGNLVHITADMLMDGIDFETSLHPPAAIGRKALAAGLSDCAAMAVLPVAAVVSLAIPERWSLAQVQQLYEGMAPLADQYHCPIVGGDTNSWPHPLVIDVTVLAQAYAGHVAVRRSGAVPGDSLYVSGPLGGSLLGRHLTFEPRVVAARRLLDHLGRDLHALMDLSDGLALDASRLAEASGVGLEIDARAILRDTLHPDAVTMSAGSARNPLDHALHDGEDFELLAACRCDAERIEFAEATFVRIGRVTPSGLTIIQPDGTPAVLEPRGWEHWRD